MAAVDIIQDFSCSVETLYNYLSDHENLTVIFAPAKIKRIREGNDMPNGVGSVRKLSLPLAPSFEETVTYNQPNERIEYRISAGFTPLKNHIGIMRFSETPRGSRLHYSIHFDGKLPFIAPVIGFGLTQGIRRGLKKLAKTLV